MGDAMKREEEARQAERRRLKGGRLLLKGVPQAEVARRCAVSRPTVWEWKQRLEQGGLQALRNGTLGRPARLDDEMRTRLAELLVGGARSHGYATELWTLPRIAKLIEGQF